MLATSEGTSRLDLILIREYESTFVREYESTFVRKYFRTCCTTYVYCSIFRTLLSTKIEYLRVQCTYCTKVPSYNTRTCTVSSYVRVQRTCYMAGLSYFRKVFGFPLSTVERTCTCTTYCTCTRVHACTLVTHCDTFFEPPLQHWKDPFRLER